MASNRPEEVLGFSPGDIARMEHESEFKLIEEIHGKNTLNLVLVVGYLRKLLDNARIVRHLLRHNTRNRKGRSFWMGGGAGYHFLERRFRPGRIGPRAA